MWVCVYVGVCVYVCVCVLGKVGYRLSCLGLNIGKLECAAVLKDGVVIQRSHWSNE